MVNTKIEHYYIMDLTDDFTIGLDNGLVPDRWQAIICINDDSVVWSTYVSSGLHGLTHWGRDKMADIF